MLSECNVPTSPHCLTVHLSILHKILPRCLLIFRLYGIKFSQAIDCVHVLASYWSLICIPIIFGASDLKHLYLLTTNLLFNFFHNSNTFQHYSNLTEFPLIIVANKHLRNTSKKVYQLITIHPLLIHCLFLRDSGKRGILLHFGEFSKGVSSSLKNNLVFFGSLFCTTYLRVTKIHKFHSFYERISLYEFVMKKHWLRCLINKSYPMRCVPYISRLNYTLDVNNRTLCIQMMNTSMHITFNVTRDNIQTMTAPHKHERLFCAVVSKQDASKHRSYALVSAHTSIRPPLLKSVWSDPLRRQNSASFETDETNPQHIDGYRLSNNSNTFCLSYNAPSAYFVHPSQDIEYSVRTTTSTFSFPYTLDSNNLCRVYPCQQICRFCSYANYKSFRNHACVSPHVIFSNSYRNYFEPTCPYCYHKTICCRDIIPVKIRCSGHSRNLNCFNVNAFPQQPCKVDCSIGVFVDLTDQNVSVFVERLPPLDNDEISVRPQRSGDLPCAGYYESDVITDCSKTFREDCKELHSRLCKRCYNINGSCQNSYSPLSLYCGCSFDYQQIPYHIGFADTVCHLLSTTFPFPGDLCFNKEGLCVDCTIHRNHYLHSDYPEHCTRFRVCNSFKTYGSKQHSLKTSDKNAFVSQTSPMKFSGESCRTCGNKLNEILPKSYMCPLFASTSQRVYIPEPIRLPRNRDVCNALRTCLVPYDQLRNYVHSSPPPRQWRRLADPHKDGFAFTLMCYNLLSPNYATPVMYPYCPSWALSWDYRRRAILDEIRVYHANIICLQELRTDQFEEVFKPELQKLNYDAVFLPKSRRRTMELKESKKVDGCAIFWQTDKFEKLHEFHHEFMLSCTSMCENPSPTMLNRVMARDNVAVGVIFETKGSLDGTAGRQFCVTTGHIHWDPEHSDVKVIQTVLWTAELWAYIDRFLKTSRSAAKQLSPTLSRAVPLSSKIPVPGPFSPAANMPVILCGDLNSLPESGVIEFLTKGSLSLTHSDFLNNGFKYMFKDWRLLEKWAIDGNSLRHRFSFNRAYQNSEGMCLTNFTYDFKGMIDYVLFTRQHFRLLGSLDQIYEPWFQEKKILGCPHVHIPSDHFALLVELELMPTPLLSFSENSYRNRCYGEIEGFSNDTNNEGIHSHHAGGNINSNTSGPEFTVTSSGFSVTDPTSAN
ncbi:unnamed protein product, partial [Heterobilharzia americana]